VGSILFVNAGSTSLKLRAVDESGGVVRVASLRELPDGIEAVAHRVVHGGARFTDPVVIDADVRTQIRQLEALAPLHNAPALRAIDEALQSLPGVPHVAVFDTCFHRTMPDEASVYALPRRWRDEWGVRRYGFHGLSVEWCAGRVPELLGGAVESLVVCHLGGGSSVTAVRGGRSVDTTMGFSPLEGVPMTTRSGSVDPGAILYLTHEQGLDAAALHHELNHESGLKGLAGGTGDMIELERRIAAGDGEASLAVDVYVLRVAGAVSSMAVSAGGLDVLAFTAGIGEGSAPVRSRVCERIRWLGVELDAERNEVAKPDCDVAATDSRVRVMVVQAREELVAARATRALLEFHRGA
jgi:acetate kinase